MIRDLVVIGVGFPDIVQIIDDINNDKKQFNFLGFLDDNPNLKKYDLFGNKVIGNIDWLDTQKNVYVINTVGRNTKIRNIVNRRSPYVSLFVMDTKVSGQNAVASICESIKNFNELKYIDVIIIARGGGSTEDLMAFNDENLATSVFESKIPIISAIGHETDTTIIDLVSDLRASTPTATDDPCPVAWSGLKTNCTGNPSSAAATLSDSYPTTTMIGDNDVATKDSTACRTNGLPAIDASSLFTEPIRRDAPAARIMPATFAFTGGLSTSIAMD